MDGQGQEEALALLEQLRGAVAMVLATAAAVIAKLTVVAFLGVYAAVYTAGALYLAVAAYRGPILAASPHGVAKWNRAAEPAAAR